MSEAEDMTQNTDDIAGQTKRGLLWRFAAKGVAAVIELGVGIVLARLLLPEDFGIMALAYMVIGFVAMFQTIGLPAALVQREMIDDDHTSTAFWTTMLMGFVLAGVMILLAGPAAAFFREENVRGVMYLLSVTMIFGTAGSVPNALLQRRIDFKKLFWPDIVGGVVYGAVGITMAYLGYSYWSLAGGAIARSFTRMVIVLSLAGFAPRLSWKRQALKDLLRFGVPVSAASGFSWAAHNVDYFIIGRVLPTSALGIYKKAYEWVAYPWKHLVAPTHSVLFPAFARLKNDRARLHYAYAHAVSGLATICFPILALLAVLAPELIPQVFGDQWRSAVRPTQILCAVGALRCLGNTAAALVHACGQANASAWTHLAHFLGVGIAVGLTARHGIIAVSWGVLGAQVINWSIVCVVVWRAAKWGPLDYLRALRVPLAGCAVMSLLMGLVRFAYSTSALPEPLGLVVAAACGTVAYVLFAAAGPFPEVRHAMKNHLRKLHRAPS